MALNTGEHNFPLLKCEQPSEPPFKNYQTERGKGRITTTGNIPERLPQCGDHG